MPRWRHCAIAPWRHCAIAPLRHCAIAPLRHCAIAPLRHCAIAPLRHCAIAPLVHTQASFNAMRYKGRDSASGMDRGSDASAKGTAERDNGRLGISLLAGWADVLRGQGAELEAHVAAHRFDFAPHEYQVTAACCSRASASLLPGRPHGSMAPGSRLPGAPPFRALRSAQCQTVPPPHGICPADASAAHWAGVALHPPHTPHGPARPLTRCVTLC